MPQPDQNAPDFTLTDDQGQVHTVSSLKGNKVLIYFYPKDDTPGCTKEACSFRDNIDAFNKRGITVFGISMDSEASHQKFREKYHLPFPLLYDKDGMVAKEYGVLNNLGGISRTTFLINEKVEIEKVWEKVKPEGHSEEVLSYLNAS